MDVDTGTDDALAILYAVRHPDLEVLGISCVAGNVSIEQTVINTCKVLDAAGAGDIPVAAGAAQPLIERARRTAASHGVDGLGGIRLPETSRQRSPLHAVELLHQLIMECTERVILLSLAPKTNVALLLTMYPEVATRLEQIIFMGGSAQRRERDGCRRVQCLAGSRGGAARDRVIDPDHFVRTRRLQPSHGEPRRRRPLPRP